MRLDDLIVHEATLRGIVFFAVLLLCLLSEWRWPLRGEHGPVGRRARNFALVVIDSLLMRFAFPMLAVQFAVVVAATPFGLFNVVTLPTLFGVLLGFLLLDAGIYFQHRMMHAVPVLWRLHRVHHSDTAFDVSLGVRFHPLEIFVSMAFKLMLIALIGATPLTVLFYEIALSVASLVTHTDISLPARLEQIVRSTLVTPDMHRIHHSPHREETDSNFSTVFSFWDRCFRTFRTAPRDGQRGMRIGLVEFDDAASRSLLGMLLQPFRKNG